jgi:hypothetical protein
MVAVGAAGGVIITMIVVMPAQAWVFRGMRGTFRWSESLGLAFIVAVLPATFTACVLAARTLAESSRR